MVIVSRLVYRKGVDLMAGVIARLHDMPNVHFLIGGDGPKRGLLEEVREKCNMQHRVTMLGALEHAKVSECAPAAVGVCRVVASRVAYACGFCAFIGRHRTYTIAFVPHNICFCYREVRYRDC